MGDTPTVSVIILNWNGRAFLPACLAALESQTYPPTEIILVDNRSSDDSVAFVHNHFPAVKLRPNERNLGFAAGNNVALRDVTADFAVLLNPDVVVQPDWLRRLLAPLIADPGIGVAGCKLLFPDGKTLNHIGGRITHPQAMPRHIGGREPDTGQHSALHDVEYVIGAAMAIRRKILPHTGLFDEGYFLYFEDVDFCFAARRAGYRVVVVPQAVATHVESAVAVRGSFSYLRRFHTGRWRFLLKYFAPVTVVADTLPAEREWLAAVEDQERVAAALAYQRALGMIRAIWQLRAEVGSDVDEATRLAIETGLSQLQEAAWQTPFSTALPPPKPAPSLISRLVGRLRSHRQSATTTKTRETRLQQQALLLHELAAAEAYGQSDLEEVRRAADRLTQQLNERRPAV